MRIKLIILVSLIYSVAFTAPKVTMINSTKEQLQLHVSINPLSIDDLKPIHVLIGIPNDKYPELQIQMLNKQNLTGFNDNIDAASVKWVQKQKLRSLNVATLKITPGTDGINNDKYYKEISISIRFDSQSQENNLKMNDDILYANVINWSIAKDWRENKGSKIFKIAAEYPVGQWIKFEVAQDRMYQINGVDLINLIPTIDLHDTRSFVLYTGSNLSNNCFVSPVS